MIYGRRNKKHPHLTFDDINTTLHCGGCNKSQAVFESDIKDGSIKEVADNFVNLHASCSERNSSC